MRVFLVHTVVEVSATIGDDELSALRTAETVQARALQERGVIRELWRQSGQTASFGIWCAEDEAALRSAIASLPMSRFMAVTISEIEVHPNAVQAFRFANDPLP